MSGTDDLEQLRRRVSDAIEAADAERRRLMAAIAAVESREAGRPAVVVQHALGRELARRGLAPGIVDDALVQQFVRAISEARPST